MTPPDALRDALASVTAWLQDDRALGRAVAADAVDRDPIGYLDAVGGLWLIVSDVASQWSVDVTAIVRDIALGVAQADVDDHAGQQDRTDPTEEA